MSTVATSSPPMIANAIGPQNTVHAIGIMPSTVEIAVSMMGRKRDMQAAITASHGGVPCARSISTCSIRITALRATMPNSARMPRMATKPSGRLKRRSVKTTPMMPMGTTLRTRARREKLCSWIIRKVTIRNSITGTTAITDACDWALSSTVPPTTIR